MKPHEDARAMLQDYFEALQHGDVELLRSVFHPEAMLVGDVNGVRSYRALPAYLDAVAQRQSPQAQGETIRTSIDALEIVGDIGSATARIHMLGFQYTDYLNLVRHQGRWTIAHKLYTHQD